MSTISRLFFKSPISLLYEHYEKVLNCANKVQELFFHLKEKNYEKLSIIKEEISNLENEANTIKNNIRNEFIKKKLFSIDKSTFFEILAIQDGIADRCEDLGVLLCLKNLVVIDEMKEILDKIVEKNIECVKLTGDILKLFDELALTSFGGKDVELIKSLIGDVAFKEHEADLYQAEILRILFNSEDKLKYTEFSLWIYVLKTLADLSNYSEKLANRIGMILE